MLCTYIKCICLLALRVCDCRLERDSTRKRAQAPGLIAGSNLASVSGSEAFCSLALNLVAGLKPLLPVAACSVWPTVSRPLAGCSGLKLCVRVSCFFSPPGSSSFRFSSCVRCQRLTGPTASERVVFVERPACCPALVHQRSCPGSTTQAGGRRGEPAAPSSSP